MNCCIEYKISEYAKRRSEIISAVRRLAICEVLFFCFTLIDANLKKKFVSQSPVQKHNIYTTQSSGPFSVVIRKKNLKKNRKKEKHKMQKKIHIDTE